MHVSFLKELSYYFLEWLNHFIFPRATHESFCFFKSSVFVVIVFSYISHSDWCVGLSHGFHLRFLSGIWCWLFSWAYLWNVSFHLLPICWLGFGGWVLKVLFFFSRNYKFFVLCVMFKYLLMSSFFFFFHFNHLSQRKSFWFVPNLRT